MFCTRARLCGTVASLYTAFPQAPTLRRFTWFEAPSHSQPPALKQSAPHVFRDRSISPTVQPSQGFGRRYGIAASQARVFAQNSAETEGRALQGILLRYVTALGSEADGDDERLALLTTSDRWHSSYIAPVSLQGLPPVFPPPKKASCCHQHST